MKQQHYQIKHIINYLRRSRQDLEKEKRTGEDTLATQKKIMDKVLSEMGIPYDQEFEIGSGDTIESRPVFIKILEKLKNKEYDAIAVKEVSRLGRGRYGDMGVIYDLIEENRIFIITPYRIYDPQNEDDKRYIRFELFMSREELLTIKNRMLTAKYSLACEGKWIAGTPPFGYKINSKTGKLKIDEENAKIIRYIFNIYINGIKKKNKTQQVSFRAIASHLTRLMIPSATGKNKWTFTQIKKILTNVAYIGTVEYRKTKRNKNNQIIVRPKKEWIIAKNAHPAIIDRDVWDKAQNKFHSVERKPKTKLDFSPCELAGLIVCAKCGRSMVRQSSTQKYQKKDGNVSHYYKEFLWCLTAGCTCVKYRTVENMILEYIFTLNNLDQDELKSIYYELKNQKSNDSDALSKDDMLQRIEKQKEQLRNKLNFIYDKYEDGVYSDAEFSQRREKLLSELNQLNKIIFPDNQDSEGDEWIKDVYEITNNIVSIYSELDKTEKNIMLRQLIDSVAVLKINKHKIEIYVIPRLQF